MRNNPNLDFVNINRIIWILVKIHNLFFKILSGIEILTSIKGHNSDRSICKNWQVTLQT